MNQNLLIAILVTFIIIKNATQGIIIPILAEYYDSLNFVLLATVLQFIVVFGMGHFIIMFKEKHRFKLPEGKIIIILIGIFNGLMSIAMMYSSSPLRAPVVLQTILASLPVIPSFFLRKLILKKKTEHKRILTIISLFFVFCSLAFAIIPVIKNWKISSFVWVLLYAGGVFFLSVYNVLQEKYTSEYDAFKLVDKLGLVFYSKLIELSVVVSLCWLEYFIGYNTHPLQSFKDSCIKFGTNYKALLLLEGFVAAYIIAYMLAVFLNSISTNYNMITPIISNPLVAVFFTVFSQFNQGIKYPIWVLCCCITCSVLGVVLWLFAEKPTAYKEINQNDNSINDNEPKYGLANYGTIP